MPDPINEIIEAELRQLGPSEYMTYSALATKIQLALLRAGYEITPSVSALLQKGKDVKLYE